MRADAQKNRQKILEAALSLMNQVGAQFSMDAVAKTAGVGAGTLYRHFPDREALIAEILDTHDSKLPSLEHLLEDAPDSLSALRLWISSLWCWVRSYEDLALPLLEASTGNYSSPLGIHCSHVIASMDNLIRQARADGHLREELTGAVLYNAVLGLAWASHNVSADDAESMLDLLEKGWLSSEVLA